MPPSLFSKTGAGPPQDSNANAVIVTAAVIQHDDRAAARFEDAMNLAHGRRGVRRVVQDAVRINQIE